MLLQNCDENFVRELAGLPELWIGTNDDGLPAAARSQLYFLGAHRGSFWIVAEERTGHAQQRVLHVEFFGLLNLLRGVRFSLLCGLHILLIEL